MQTDHLVLSSSTRLATFTRSVYLLNSTIGLCTSNGSALIGRGSVPENALERSRRFSTCALSRLSQSSPESLAQRRNSGRDLARLRHAHSSGLVRVALPFALLITFAFCPGVSAGIFKAWLCVAYDVDTEQGTYQSFLVADLSVRCNNAGHDGILRTAIIYVLVWPIGVPLLYMSLLYACRKSIGTGKPSVLAHATRFLHDEYRPEVYWWGCFNLLRRLVLTGVVLLIPQSSAMLRLLAAIMMCLCVGAPFHGQAVQTNDRGLLDVSTQIALTCIFVSAIFIKAFDDLATRASVPRERTRYSASTIRIRCQSSLSSSASDRTHRQRPHRPSRRDDHCNKEAGAMDREMARTAITAITQCRFPVVFISFSDLVSIGRFEEHEYCVTRGCSASSTT